MKRFWLINLVLFQLCWFISAYFTAVALPALALIIMIHFLLSPTPKGDGRLLLLVPLGIAVDKVLIDLNLLSMQDNAFPIWLGLLWCIFIISFNHSLKWLMSLHLLLIALIGAIAGPMSYRLGVEMGALTFGWSNANALLTLSLVWCVLLPILAVCFRYVVRTELTKRGV
ncbi:DUF2878 domain-containing protein [Shewanella sp. VB17]|uniref:DUF2878 domain-containing protein n=1 Tax=Shewanella sp. VB17 TaxID=2739432 RepID=UPI0015636220|nr:DUF2878 domain-containing protein [Shewanella sp. VB17]NRD74258.1 DUF2878 domain-containing protein [Shewanella sp. VB17]